MRAHIREVIGSVEAFDVLLVISAGVLAYGLSLINPALPFVALGALGLYVWSRAAGPS